MVVVVVVTVVAVIVMFLVDMEGEATVHWVLRLPFNLFRGGGSESNLGWEMAVRTTCTLLHQVVLSFEPRWY